MLQEGVEQALGGEQTLGDYRVVQRRRSGGGALKRHPRDTTVAWQGSAHAAMMAPSQEKLPTTHR
jgi:hypothetical protein